MSSSIRAPTVFASWCWSQGPGQLNRWLDYERDIRADYEKAFGEAPGALLAIGIMTDTDNTRSSTLAWYGPVTLVPDTLLKK
ncbi:DUF3047 domain-containing protein [Polaromonas sp. P2-4]|nr:DUF3047 domain-containing protein [Polaromonas sp. P2-4]